MTAEPFSTRNWVAHPFASRKGGVSRVKTREEIGLSARGVLKGREFTPAGITANLVFVKGTAPAVPQSPREVGVPGELVRRALTRFRSAEGPSEVRIAVPGELARWGERTKHASAATPIAVILSVAVILSGP